MPNRNAQSGTRYERKTIDHLKESGVIDHAHRSPASKSPADIIGWDADGSLTFVQVKSGRLPFSGAALRRAARELADYAPTGKHVGRAIYDWVKYRRAPTVHVVTEEGEIQ